MPRAKRQRTDVSGTLVFKRSEKNILHTGNEEALQKQADRASSGRDWLGEKKLQIS